MGTSVSFSCRSAIGRGRGLLGISGSSSSSSPRQRVSVRQADRRGLHTVNEQTVFTSPGKSAGGNGSLISFTFDSNSSTLSCKNTNKQMDFKSSVSVCFCRWMSYFRCSGNSFNLGSLLSQFLRQHNLLFVTLIRKIFPARRKKNTRMFTQRFLLVPIMLFYVY